MSKKKSAYQKRIETALADLSLNLDARTIVKFMGIRDGEVAALTSTITGADEFTATKVYRHTGMVCQLCGHNPIKNVFVIEHKINKKELHIGSDCARNYINTDLVDAVCREYAIEYKKIVNPIKFADTLPILEWAAERKGVAALASVRRPLWNFINSGDPRNIIFKINAGKSIGKREKEVIAFWTHVYNNQDEVVIIDNIQKLIESSRRYAMDLRMKVREDKMKMEANKRKTALFFRNQPLNIASGICSWLKAVHFEHGNVSREAEITKALVNANANETKFINDVKRSYIARAESLSYRQAAWLTTLISRSTKPEDVDCSQVEALIESARKKKLNYRQENFVDSVEYQFEKKGTLSVKQVAYLSKVAA